jgi:hypothetical protein
LRKEKKERQRVRKILKINYARQITGHKCVVQYASLEMAS